MKKQINKILVIDEDEYTRDLVYKGLQNIGFDVSSTPLNKTDGLNIYIDTKPDLLIIDLQTIENLEILKDLHNADPFAQTIVISKNTETSFAIECIRHGALDYIRKPLEVIEIIHAIKRIEDRNKLMRITYEPDINCVKFEDKILVFGNETENLPVILNQAVFNASVLCKEIDSLKMSLGEIIINAMEHGNLDISMNEKAEAIQKGVYAELLEQRRKDPKFAVRVVTLHVHMDTEKIVYYISDQGKGFDFKTVYNADPYSHFGSGLGLTIAKSFFSEITFEGCGNRVKLVYTPDNKGKKRE